MPVLTAKIQPAQPAPDATPRAFILDGPPAIGGAALRAFLADLGVPAGPEDQLTCRGTAQLAGLIAVEPALPLVVEPRSYLVAAPANTASAALATFLQTLGIDLGPDDRILRAGHAPLPMLVRVTPPLRIAAAEKGTPP